MLPYAVVLIGCFLLLLLARMLGRAHQRRIALACVLILTSFATLRGYVGTDTYAYHLIYDNNADQNLDRVLQIVEPVFALLIKLVALLSGDSFAFVIVIGIIQGALVARLIRSSRNPVDFLMIYMGVFYLSFQFNVLRAGTAILFLIMAARVPKEQPNQGIFFFLGTAAVLSHYSALLGFLPMLLMRLRSKSPKGLLFSALIISITIYYFLDLSRDVLIEKFLIYAAMLAPDGSKSSSLSLILGIPIYLAIYATAVNRHNWLGLTLMLSLWILLRWLTSLYALVGRVEMIVNALLLFHMIEFPATGWRKRLRTISIIALASMWIVGTLLGLANESSILDNLDVFDDVYLSSPFTPYRYFWERR